MNSQRLRNNVIKRLAYWRQRLAEATTTEAKSVANYMIQRLQEALEQ